MRAFVELSRRVNGALAAVAGVALIVLMVVLLVNAVLRVVATPISGNYEIVTMLAAVIFGLALGDAQTYRAHVSIDLLVRGWRKRARIVVGALVTIAALALFVQLVLSLWVYTANLQARGAATDLLGLPVWPSALIVTVGLGGLVIALAADLAKASLAWKSDDPAVNIF